MYAGIFYGTFVHIGASLNFSPWCSLLPDYKWTEMRMLGTILFHSVQKQLITEGAGYVMTFTQQLSFTEQGGRSIFILSVYSLVCSRLRHGGQTGLARRADRSAAARGVVRPPLRRPLRSECDARRARTIGPTVPRNLPLVDHFGDGDRDLQHSLLVDRRPDLRRFVFFLLPFICVRLQALCCPRTRAASCCRCTRSICS